MNRIAELRKKLGLTQTRLGEEIGVSQQTISKYENGDENIPGDMLLALSKFFRVPIDYILRKEEECKFCSNGTPILKSAVHSF